MFKPNVPEDSAARNDVAQSQEKKLSNAATAAERGERWGRVVKRAARGPTLKRRDYQVLIAIASEGGRDRIPGRERIARRSMGKIAEDTGLRRPHVAASIANLLASKFIRIHKKGGSGGWQCNEYEILIFPREVTPNDEVFPVAVTGVPRSGNTSVPASGNPIGESAIRAESINRKKEGDFKYERALDLGCASAVADPAPNAQASRPMRYGHPQTRTKLR